VLRDSGVSGSTMAVVSVAMNGASGAIGFKDIVKVEDRNLKKRRLTGFHL